MKKVKLLKISFWLGAIADFIYGFVILIPSRAGVSEYVYPMGLFAAAAISWGVMLLLALKSPIERRWILIPTILVIVLLGFANLYSLSIGAIDFNTAFPRILLCVAISAFMFFSYVKTNKFNLR